MFIYYHWKTWVSSKKLNVVTAEFRIRVRIIISGRIPISGTTTVQLQMQGIRALHRQGLGR